jgi:hypothetical protein
LSQIPVKSPFNGAFGWIESGILIPALSKSGGPATSHKKFFLGCIITLTGKMPLWRTEMKKELPYHEAFDMFLDCLSNENSKDKKKIEKYVVHRKIFGKHAAARVYPEVHNIIIHDPIMKDIWKTFLKTVDSL